MKLYRCRRWWFFLLLFFIPASLAQATNNKKLKQLANTSFPVSEHLRPAVQFWTDIFYKYGRNTALIHDSKYPHIVWQVVHFKKSNKRPTSQQIDILVAPALKQLRSDLKHLEAKHTPTTAQQKARFRLLKKRGKDYIRGASRRLRIQRGMRDQFIRGIKRATPHLEKLRSIFSKQQLPTELIALSFVESMFNPRARSHAGAAGLWQLMPATARQYHLTVNRKRDHRYNIKRSTLAAARMLQSNFKRLGSWPLAITAYNHGPNGMRRAVKAAGTTDLSHLIKHYKKRTWGFASKNFYAEFVAALRVCQLHNIDLKSKSPNH